MHRRSLLALASSSLAFLTLGLTAARAIRDAESGSVRVPIVALTGNAMPGDREACVAAGMDDYLAKPFSLTALRAMVDKWTGPQAA